MFKAFARSQFAGRIASFFIGAYIRLVHTTTRWSWHGREHYEALADDGEGFIMAFWHGRLLLAPTVRSETGRRVFMLISAHRDGEIIAQGVKSFGIEFIRGSSADPKKTFKNKSGASAVAQMVAVLEGRHIIGVTPDGPRGPGRQAKKGIARLAQMSGRPILPAAYATSRGRLLGTWDRFLLAAPFSRGYYVAGPAISPPRDNSPEAIEECRAALEAGLNAVTDEADRLAGKLADGSVSRDK